MREFYRKRWFWVIIILVIVVLYLVLGALGIIPTYRCGSTMGPDGPVNWCVWHRGTGILVG